MAATKDCVTAVEHESSHEGRLGAITSTGDRMVSENDRGVDCEAAETGRLPDLPEDVESRSLTQGVGGESERTMLASSLQLIR